VLGGSEQAEFPAVKTRAANAARADDLDHRLFDLKESFIASLGYSFSRDGTPRTRYSATSTTGLRRPLFK
jgi:hypothetical protein